MSQITLNIPERLDAYIAVKMGEGYPSPESVILAAVEIAQRQEDEEVKVSLPGMTSGQREALEGTLEDRINGPFVPLGDDFVERVMSKAVSRAAQRRPAANA